MSVRHAASSRTRVGVVCVALLALLSATWSCSCSVSRPWVRPDWAGDGAAPDPAAADVRLILVGDAGYAAHEDPVLAALAREAALQPDRTCVVFLGDNIYPHGLPPQTDADFPGAERQLRAQIDAVTATGARCVFVAGNHDYALDGWDGWERERKYIEALNRPGLSVLPAAGCPGPETLDLGTRLRIVAVDTQWWFQDGAKPRHPDSHCRYDSDSEIAAGLDSALAAAGDRHVVVVGHHPLATHGHHGGHFDWQDHIFPLRAAADWAWLPLPVLGSLYPIARKLGITEQDLAHGRYRELVHAFHDAFRRHPPLVYAAGHEHTLQVLEGGGPRLHVVSGSGSVDRSDKVGRGDDTLFACGCSGYARLDFLPDGRVWLRVVPMDANGNALAAVERWITPR